MHDVNNADIVQTICVPMIPPPPHDFEMITLTKATATFRDIMTLAHDPKQVSVFFLQMNLGMRWTMHTHDMGDREAGGGAWGVKLRANERVGCEIDPE